MWRMCQHQHAALGDTVGQAMSDSTILRLLREASASCEADDRLQKALIAADQIVGAAQDFPAAVMAWRRDRNSAPLHGWPDSTKETLVFKALSEAHRYVVLAKALVHEAHAEARRGHVRDL